MKRQAKATRAAKEFKYKQFEGEVILWSVRWYGQFALSYRDLVLMAAERGLRVAHTTIMRWVHEYAPKLEKRHRCKKFLCMWKIPWCFLSSDTK